MRATVRIQREYRVAIPPVIRESQGLEYGDIVEIAVRPVGDGGRGPVALSDDDECGGEGDRR